MASVALVVRDTAGRKLCEASRLGEELSAPWDRERRDASRRNLLGLEGGLEAKFAAAAEVTWELRVGVAAVGGVICCCFSYM